MEERLHSATCNLSWHGGGGEREALAERATCKPKQAEKQGECHLFRES